MSDSDFWRGRHVMVGGGCGFLGSYLVPQLVEAGAAVTVVDSLENGYLDNLAPVAKEIRFIQADLRDPTVCQVTTSGMDTVINLAARAYGIAYSSTHHGEMLVHNLLAVLGTLEAARQNGVERYLIVSSSCVYPDDAPVPTPELEVFTGMPESVNEGYGWAKRVQELAGLYYARETGMKVSIVRPFNAYGGNYRWKSRDEAHVVPAVVKRVMDGEDPLVVWGSGKQRRNFVHASDATRAMLLVLENEVVARPVNIGYEDDISIAELVDLVCQISGRFPQVQFDVSRPEGRFRKAADATLLRQVTNSYQPRVSLEEGIAEMIEWYHRSFGGKAGQL